MKIKRILIVDNEPDYVKLLQKLLVHRGYQVDSVNDIENAIISIKNSKNIDLVITDIRLIDDTNSIDLSGLLFAKGISNSIPVIVLSDFQSSGSFLKKQISEQKSRLVFFASKNYTDKQIIHTINQVQQINLPLSIIFQKYAEKIFFYTGIIMIGFGIASVVSQTIYFLIGAILSAIIGTVVYSKIYDQE